MSAKVVLCYPRRFPARCLTVGVLLALIVGSATWMGLHLWASQHLRSARICLERHHNAEALNHLQACLKIWPRDAEALLLAARAARRLGSWEQAETYLDEYQRLRGPDDNVSLERVLLRIERGEVDTFRDFCQALVERGHPFTPLILEALTHSCLRLYRLNEASSYLLQWQAQQPDDPQALLYQAWLHEQRRQLQAAADAYRRAAELDPERLDTRSRLAEVLLRLGAYGEALPQLQHLLKRKRNDPQTQVQLAQYHLHFGQMEEAERLLDDLLAQQPRYAPALAERGRLAAERGQLASAEKWLRQALDQQPGDYATRYRLFLCLQRSGKEVEAEEELRRAEEIQRDIVRLQEIVLHRMGQDPHSPSLHLEVGLIFVRAGQLHEALHWLQSALNNDPNHVPTHKALMEFYMRVGKHGLAAKHRQKVEGLTGGSLGTLVGSEKRP